MGASESKPAAGPAGAAPAAAPAPVPAPAAAAAAASAPPSSVQVAAPVEVGKSSSAATTPSKADRNQCSAWSRDDEEQRINDTEEVTWFKAFEAVRTQSGQPTESKDLDLAFALRALARVPVGPDADAMLWSQESARLELEALGPIEARNVRGENADKKAVVTKQMWTKLLSTRSSSWSAARRAIAIRALETPISGEQALSEVRALSQPTESKRAAPVAEKKPVAAAAVPESAPAPAASAAPEPAAPAPAAAPATVVATPEAAPAAEPVVAAAVAPVATVVTPEASQEVAAAPAVSVAPVEPVASVPAAAAAVAEVAEVAAPAAEKTVEEPVVAAAAAPEPAAAADAAAPATTEVVEPAAVEAEVKTTVEPEAEVVESEPVLSPTSAKKAPKQPSKQASFNNKGKKRGGKK